MKGSVPGVAAQETPGSCDGSAAEIGTRCTWLETAGHPGHLRDWKRTQDLREIYVPLESSRG